MKRRNAGKGHARKNWLNKEGTNRLDKNPSRGSYLKLNSVPRQSQPNIYFRKLTEADDDTEAYLTAFERLVTSEKLEQQDWAFKLTPYLTGKAQQAYAALSSEELSS